MKTKKRDQMRYLRVSGRLAPNNTLYLRPSYLSENSRDSLNVENSPLQIELYGTSGLILSWGAMIAPARSEAMNSKLKAPAYYHVRAKVPFHSETKKLVFRNRGVAIHEIKVPEAGPRLNSKSVRVKFDKKHCSIKWEATHDENLPLFYHVSMSADGGRNWVRLASRLQEPELVIARDALSGGKSCRIKVTAYDGVNTVSAETSAPQAPPSRLIAEILSPRPGVATLETSPINLNAYAGATGRPGKVSDCNLQWSVNGKPLAEGHTALWYWDRPGRYTLSLNASLGKLKAKDSITVVVGASKKNIARK